MRTGGDVRGHPGLDPPAPGGPGRTLHLACKIAQPNHGDRVMTHRLHDKLAALETSDDASPP